jgi:hypothetical protein
MDPPLLAQANLGPKEPAREPAEQLQGLRITVQARLTNVQPWDAHVTRLTRHAPACEAIIDEINLLERLATLSRAFQAIHLEFTGNWTARVLRRHWQDEWTTSIAPLMAGRATAGSTSRLLAGSALCIQAQMRVMQKVFWGWEAMIRIFPGSATGTHEDCLNEYYYDKDPLSFVAAAMSDHPHLGVRGADAYRHERTLAWLTGKGPHLTAMKRDIVHQIHATTALRNAAMEQTTLLLAGTGGSPRAHRPHRARGPASHSTKGPRNQRGQCGWVKCGKVETCEALTNIRIEEGFLEAFYERITLGAAREAATGALRSPYRGVVALLSLPQPGFFEQGFGGMRVNWRQAYASLFLQREGFVEKTQGNRLNREFWLPEHAWDPKTVEESVQEIAKLLLDCAFEFNVHSYQMQDWLEFILEFPRTVIGPIGIVLLSQPRGSSFLGIIPRRQRVAPWRGARRLESPNAGGIKKQLPEEAIHQLVGLLAILLIRASPCAASPSSFPLPGTPQEVWALMETCVRDGEELVYTSLLPLLRQALGTAGEIRQSGNLPILAQDIRGAFWEAQPWSRLHPN